MAREALEVLKECEAFLEGHFLLSSGRHSGAYCQMAFLQQYPDKAAEVMAPVAEKLKELNVDVVVGPATVPAPRLRPPSPSWPAPSSWICPTTPLKSAPSARRASCPWYTWAAAK